MDYEKKYKEALEFFKRIYPNIGGELKEQIENLFPELKENEDEKIRKAILDHLTIMWGNSQDDVCGVNVEDAIAWLEKQGQSTFDKCRQEGDRIVENPDGTHFNISQLERVAKVEPKFKVGAWVVENGTTKEPVQIVRYEKRPDGTLVWFSNGTGTYIDFLYGYHLWTIKDAKDGDILAGGDWVFVFRKFHINGFPKCHCHYDLTLKEFKVDTDSYMAGGGDNYPATKKQRDLLFEKMHEAGYMWDSENKQLLSLKAEPTQKPK